MEYASMVYCVSCGTMTRREKAEEVFQTGFYKITIPLATCQECAKKEPTNDNAADKEVWHQAI